MSLSSSSSSSSKEWSHEDSSHSEWDSDNDEDENDEEDDSLVSCLLETYVTVHESMGATDLPGHMIQWILTLTLWDLHKHPLSSNLSDVDYQNALQERIMSLLPKPDEYVHTILPTLRSLLSSSSLPS